MILKQNFGKFFIFHVVSWFIVCSEIWFEPQLQLVDSYLIQQFLTNNMEGSLVINVKINKTL
jgi:hypothetical protein